MALTEAGSTGHSSNRPDNAGAVSPDSMTLTVTRPIGSQPMCSVPRPCARQPAPDRAAAIAAPPPWAPSTTQISRDCPSQAVANSLSEICGAMAPAIRRLLSRRVLKRRCRNSRSASERYRLRRDPLIDPGARPSLVYRMVSRAVAVGLARKLVIRKHVAQRGFLDFAGGGVRHVFDELHVVRNPPLGDLAVEVGFQFIRRGLLTGCFHHNQ